MLVSSPFRNLMQAKEELGIVCVSITSIHIKAQYSNKKQQVLLEGLSKVNNAYRQTDV